MWTSLSRTACALHTEVSLLAAGWLVLSANTQLGDGAAPLHVNDCDIKAFSWTFWNVVCNPKFKVTDLYFSLKEHSIIMHRLSVKERTCSGVTDWKLEHLVLRTSFGKTSWLRKIRNASSRLKIWCLKQRIRLHISSWNYVWIFAVNFEIHRWLVIASFHFVFFKFSARTEQNWNSTHKWA